MYSDAIACGVFESLGKDARYSLTYCVEYFTSLYH